MSKKIKNLIYFIVILGLILLIFILLTKQEVNANNYIGNYSQNSGVSFIGNTDDPNYNSYNNNNNNPQPIWYDEEQKTENNNTSKTNNTTINNSYSKNKVATTTKTTASKTTKTESEEVDKEDEKVSNGAKLGAGVLWGSKSFIPSGLFQWIIFFLLLTSAIILWRKIYLTEEDTKIPLKYD
jgi:hypothetical protein